MVERVTSENAPSLEEMGLPISQAMTHGDTVYVAGQVGIDPETGDFDANNITEETRQVLDNVAAILDAAGTSIENVVKATVFVEDMSDFDTVNEVYQEYMTEPYPARSAIEVGALAGDYTVEIEVIAAR